MQQIADWLEKLGMSEYAQCFADNGIDISVLPHLTDQDLKDIGVLLGHRRRILAAIAELGDVAATTPKPAVSEPKPQDIAERRQFTVMFSECFVAQLFRQRPSEAGTPRPPDAFPDSRRAHSEAGSNLAFGHASGRQPQHVADFCAWVISVQACLAPVEREPSHADSRITQRRPSPHPQAGRDRPEWVVAINRNARSQSIGIAGRDHPVCALRTSQ